MEKLLQYLTYSTLLGTYLMTTVIPLSAATYDAVAHSYEQGRPEYPIADIHALLSGVEYAAGLCICDLGAGTGKLTKAILSAHPDAHVIAVEPSMEMCAIFAQQLPHVTLKQGSAEAIPLPDASVDIVLVGTAFHWFCTEHALCEIARVLKPRGKLGLIWNVFDTQVSWVDALRTLLDTYRTSDELLCNHDSLQWKSVFDTTNLFGLLTHITHSYTYKGTIQDVSHRIASSKVYGALTSSEQTTIYKKAHEIVGNQREDIDIPYRIEIYWAQKRSAR